MTKKRRLFDELMEGVSSMGMQREGAIALRSYEGEAPEAGPSSLPSSEC